MYTICPPKGALSNVYYCLCCGRALKPATDYNLTLSERVIISPRSATSTAVTGSNIRY